MKADQMLEQLEGEVAEALENLRNLARGVYPPLLADRVLAAAIRAQSRRSPVPVRIQADRIGRYAPELEAAVYFCHPRSPAGCRQVRRRSEVVVDLSEDRGELVFQIEDDGRGFDREATPLGSGLQMSDRMAALGGELEVRSRPGTGTAVEGRLPVQPEGLASSPSRS